MSHLKAITIRAIHTMAYAAVGVITATTTYEVNWCVVLQTSMFAGIMCVLASVGVKLPEVSGVKKE